MSQNLRGSVPLASHRRGPKPRQYAEGPEPGDKVLYVDLSRGRLEEIYRPHKSLTQLSSAPSRAGAGASAGSPGHGPAAHRPREAARESLRDAAADQPDGRAADPEEGPFRPAQAA